LIARPVEVDLLLLVVGVHRGSPRGSCVGG
jgi:hypothetical protein